MPGILAEQLTNGEGLSEGKGGPISEQNEGDQQTEESGGSLEDGGQSQKLKEALEDLNLDKNGEAEMDEDEQQPRLSSPDSGVWRERERERERDTSFTIILLKKEHVRLIEVSYYISLCLYLSHIHHCAVYNDM